MENYYRDYTIVKEFLRKEDRAVFLARTNMMFPGYPVEFVIKQFVGGEPSEAAIHKQLQNTYNHILKVFDTWTDAHYYYMSMEYCEDGDLHTYLQLLNGQPLGFQYILHISLQLSTTVSIMHQHQICHRDIKPLNIYITNNKQSYKLADFGESKRVESNELGYHTIIGTPLYMSPEQHKNFENKLSMKVNPYRDDIWALGKTFIEISIGRLCPETHYMNMREIHRLIDEKFTYFGYPSKYCNIVKRMMVELKDFRLDAERVKVEIWDLYNDMFDPRNVALRLKAEGNGEGVVNENRELNVVTQNSDMRSKAGLNANVAYTRNPLIEEVTEDSNKSDSDLSSSISSSEEYMDENFDHGLQIISPKLNNPSPINSPALKNNPPEIFLPKPQVTFLNPQPVQVKVPENVYNLKPPTASQPNPHKINLLKLQEIKGTGKISIAQEKSRDPEEEKMILRTSLVSQEFTQAKIVPKQNFLEHSTQENNKPGLEGNLPVIIMPAAQSPVLSTCVICGLNDSKESITLSCKHLYHKPCFILLYEDKILKLTKRSLPMKCNSKGCNSNIEFSFLDNVTWSDKKVRQIISLQLYSNTKFSCPNCEKEIDSFMLSKKMKAKTKKCMSCKNKFCSFCGVKGSHRFFCDLLREFKTGKLDQDKYIEKK